MKAKILVSVGWLTIGNIITNKWIDTSEALIFFFFFFTISPIVVLKPDSWLQSQD